MRLIYLHSDEVPSYTLDVVENGLDGRPFETFGNHSLAYSTVSLGALLARAYRQTLPDMGQLTPAQVTASPLLFMMSRPWVLNGA